MLCASGPVLPSALLSASTADSVLYGAGPAQLAMAAAIPADLWQELRHEGLIDPAAPTPGTGAATR